MIPGHPHVLQFAVPVKDVLQLVLAYVVAQAANVYFGIDIPILMMAHGDF